MKGYGKSLTVGFSAGALGALISAIALWALVTYGVTDRMDVSLAVAGSWSGFLTGLYAHIFWGGVWGFLFGLPLLENSVVKRALFIGLLPSLLSFLVLYPFVAQMGFFGTGYGTLTFIPILVINWIWGFVAASWYAKTK